MLAEAQIAVRDHVRNFAQARIRPHSQAYEAAGAFPADLFIDLADMGLLGMTAPEAFGGAGADYVSYALALIELAAADGALSTIVSIQNSLIVNGLARFGDAEQQRRFLPD